MKTFECKKCGRVSAFYDYEKPYCRKCDGVPIFLLGRGPGSKDWTNRIVKDMKSITQKF